MKTKHAEKGKIKTLSENGTLNKNPEKVKDRKFLENDFFDPSDILQVKYEMLRKVDKEKISITDAVSLFGFSRLSFYRLHEGFKKSGLPGLIPHKKGPKKAHKLSNDIMDFIQTELGKDESLKARGLKQIIEKKFGFTVHIRTIERALTRREKKDDTL